MSEAAVWASVHVAHPMRCDVYQINVPRTITCVISRGRLHLARHATVLPTECLYLTDWYDSWLAVLTPTQ